MAEDEKVGDIFTPNKHNMSTVVKKIESLEKKVDDIINSEEHRKEHEKISSLRDDFNKHIDRGWEVGFQNQITELKERVEGIYKSVHGISPDEPEPAPSKPKMTDDEIMLFNEELMAKINKRKAQPLEEPPEDYVLSADGYCLNPKKFIPIKKADLKWLFDNLKSNSPKQKWNELIKKYLKGDKE